MRQAEHEYMSRAGSAASQAECEQRYVRHGAGLERGGWTLNHSLAGLFRQMSPGRDPGNLPAGPSHVPKHPKPSAPPPKPATLLAQAGTSSPYLGMPVGIATALFVVGCVLYGLYFFRVPIGPGMTRMETLPFLLAPDQLLAQWCDVPDGRVNIVDRLPLMLLAGSVWAVAWLTGRLVLLRTRLVRQLDRLEHFAFALGLGLSLWSLGTLAVGLAGGLRQPLWFAGAAVVVIALNLVLRTTGTPKVNDASSRVTLMCHIKIASSRVPRIALVVGPGGAIRAGARGWSLVAAGRF